MSKFFNQYYAACVRDYLSRLDRRSLVDFYHSHAEPFGLDKAQFVVSMGLGNGVYDASIVDKCMPNLEEYVGIDPGEYVEEVKGNLLGVKSELKVETFRECAQDWAAKDSPSKPVDVVFCLEMLKHLPDKRGFLKQCWDWLAPGGALVIQTWGDKVVFNDFQREVLDGNTKDMAATGKYWRGDIRKDLELLNLPIQEFEVDTVLDLQNISREFVTYLYWRDITNEEFQKTFKWLEDYRQRESKNGTYHYDTVVFVMVKN